MSAGNTAVEGILQQIRRRERQAMHRAIVLTVLPIVMAGLLLTYTAATMARARNEKRQLEVQAAQLDTLVQQHRAKLDSLLTQIAGVRGQLDSVRAALRTAQSELSTFAAHRDTVARVAAEQALSRASVSVEQLGTAIQQTSQRAEYAKYTIGIYAYRVAAEQYDRVRGKLESDGYVITQGGLLEQRPSYLSPWSRVLYYDEAAKEKAGELAAELGTLTRTRFEVWKGAGLGVAPGQERWTFFIHYVGQ